ncbi:MAG: GNAT family N-acetyltransferase, partial [Natronospirillum sp.]
MTTPEYTIGPAKIEHLDALPDIERAAAALFPAAVLPPHLGAGTVSPAELARAQAKGYLWVAETSDHRPVGFALIKPTMSAAHLAEVDVHPDHQQRGIGRRLVLTALEWSATEGYQRVTLTTFTDVPWNAPFYERLGFCRLDPETTPPDLARKLSAEKR